jgi:hypothetical protein
MSIAQDIDVSKEKEMGSKAVNPGDPSSYGCQILLEKTTIEQAKDSSFPNDAKLIWYIVDDVTHMDLTRCRKMSELFDMYYDKYGPGAVQKIDFGYGRVNPKLWGYKSPDKKKKK